MEPRKHSKSKRNTDMDRGELQIFASYVECAPAFLESIIH